MSAFVNFLIVSINEIELEILKNFKTDDIEISRLINEVIAEMEIDNE